MVVSMAMGDPLYRWMVYFMENPNQKMDDLFRGTSMTSETCIYLINTLVSR